MVETPIVGQVLQYCSVFCRLLLQCSKQASPGVPNVPERRKYGRSGRKMPSATKSSYVLFRKTS
jgi:hypothetical protein